MSRHWLQSCTTAPNQNAKQGTGKRCSKYLVHGLGTFSSRAFSLPDFLESASVLVANLQPPDGKYLLKWLHTTVSQIHPFSGVHKHMVFRWYPNQVPDVNCIADSLYCSFWSQKTVTGFPFCWIGESNAFLTPHLPGNRFSWLVISWELLGPRGLGVGAEVKNPAKTCCLTWCTWVFAHNFFRRKTGLKGRLFTFLLWNMRVQEELPPKPGKAV